ncbi:hypothetical protein QBC39DRAFT_362314 [Podospora conica]|nr:hypothetical protein QBC39DRAFT_362314 [Schizothecium conicum]
MDKLPRRDTELQQKFFGHPLQSLRIRRRKHLDHRAIVAKVLNMFAQRLLGNLNLCLAQIDPDPDMTKLQNALGGHSLKALIKGGHKRLKCRAFLGQAANKFTKRRPQGGGAEMDSGATLTTGEAPTLPTSDSPPRVPQLTSLVPGRFYVLPDDLGLGIRKACPRFKEIFCIGWENPGPALDRRGRLIQNLAPNTLVIYRSHVEEEGTTSATGTPLALRNHRLSLRHLYLTKLNLADVECLPAAGPLVNLEIISIAAHWMLPTLVVPRGSPAYKNLLGWLRQMVSLKRLSFKYLPSQSELARDVLKRSDLRLHSLALHYMSMSLTSPQDHIRLYNEIAKQTALRELYLGVYLGGNMPEEFDKAHPLQLAFSKMLTQLMELRHLVLDMPMFYATFVKVAEACPHLEDVRVRPHDAPDDPPTDTLAWFNTLKSLRSLKWLRWCSDSSMTSAFLADFIRDLADDPQGSHRNFSLEIPFQRESARLRNEEVVYLEDLISRRLGGCISIDYREVDWAIPRL